MSNDGARRALALLLLALSCLLPASPEAADEEGCLVCHRFALRSATVRGGRDLRVADPAGGAHDPLRCSDCHVDAPRAPHPAPPGPSSCLGACHGGTAASAETHRRAAFGGATESHRGASAPDPPCRLCHRATDSPGALGAVAARCARCHPQEGRDVERGVHRILLRTQGERACLGCHKAHPASPSDAKVACAGTGCHAKISSAMMRFGGHAGGGRAAAAGRRLAEGGVFLALTGLGLAVGQLLSPRPGSRRGTR